MLWWPGKDARRRRIEEQAYAWVVRIDDDQGRHEAGLRKWIGSDEKRAEIYNRARRSFLDAAAPAQALYGTMRERHAAAARHGMRAIPYRRLIAIAAGLTLIGFALSLAMSALTGRLDTPQSPPLSSMSLATRIGEVRAVQLSDGSKIVLDTNTRMDVHFTPKARSLDLIQGRARFEVAHDRRWPFIVTAGGGTVTARGTMFDVDVDNGVAVQLISGAVDVRLPSAPQKPVIVRHLKAGQKVMYNIGDKRTNIGPFAARQSDGQWITGMKTFDDASVREIIEEANRYTTRKIVLADPAIGEHQVFLDVDIRNPLSVARKLAALLELRADESRSDVIELTANR